MRNVRGVIALAVSLGLALVAARAVFVYLNKPRPSRVAAVKPVVAPVKPPAFADSIPAGLRVFNIRVNDVSGTSRNFQNGDIVDVVAVGDSGGQTGEKVARVVLQNVAVLRTGVAPAKAGKPDRRNREWTVPLLVTPEQGALLAAVTASAEIRLLARGPGDTGRGVVAPVVYSPLEGTVGLWPAGSDAAAAIPAGMRAVTIAARDTDGICGLLRQGDRVDVLVTSPFSKFASGGGAPGAEGRVTEFRMASRVLLQDVAVLTTESILSGGPAIDRPVERVTLLVTPAQAEKLAVVSDATRKSVLRLISRSADDRQRVTTSGQNLADLLTRRRQYHRIDIYKGTQVKEKTFYR